MKLPVKNFDKFNNFNYLHVSMFEFENYKSNLDLSDKNNIKDVEVDKSVVYRGDINIIKKPKIGNDCASPVLAAAIVGLQNTATPLPKNDPFYHCYTDIDAQELYLSSKPTGYFILGKPGSGAYSLGEALSKKLNCIHLCPKNIINDEIEQKSPTGLTIDFNMRHNYICQVDTILSIMLKKLESPAVQHRGYIISGLPLVTSSKKSHYYFNSMYSEESTLVVNMLLYDMICSMKKRKARKNKGPSDTPHSSLSSEEINVEDELEEEEEKEEAIEEQEEQKVELPKFILDPTSDIIMKKKPHFMTKESMMLQQILDLISCNMEPNIIIYMTGPDIDLVTKKNHKYLNYTNGLLTFEPITFELDQELRWPPKYIISDYTAPFSIHTFNPKYNCRQPINFAEKSIDQICNYKNIIYPFIEKKLNDFDPKSVIRLDARTSLHNMTNHVLETLLMFSIKPVLIPEPLYLEEPGEDLDEFWKSVDELNVIHSDSLSFTYTASPWCNRCPVELKNRQSVVGNPKFAVTLFKHVYLLSSLSAMVSFCRNPRTFLQLKYLEPTCRIIIIGTKLSGKSFVAHCLSWIFDTPIICYEKFLEEEKEKKYETLAKTILSEIIATIEDARFAEWQSLEIDRCSQLEAWNKLTLEGLKAYLPYLIQSIKYNRKDSISGTSIKGDEKEKPDEEFTQSFNYYRTTLAYLPCLDDLQLCENLIIDSALLKNYAPTELTTLTPKPNIPVLGDKDVTVAISEYIVMNELQKELEPTVEELMTEVIQVISVIDSKTKESTNSEQMYGKFIIDGFPSDLEYWEYLNDSKLLPDYTVTLIENKEVTPELIQHYNNVEKLFKNYQERFLLAYDPLITTKLLISGSLKSKETYIKRIVHDTVMDAIDQIPPTEADISANNEVEIMASYAASIEKFREDFDSIKLKLDENSKCYIEVELDDKTDIQILEEILLNLRKSYYFQCEIIEDEVIEDLDNEESNIKDELTYNDSRNLCETNIFCPIAYYDYGVLWEGKPEFCVKYNSKLHYFSKPECTELFQLDVTKYQAYNKPYKVLPVLRICVTGCIGNGKSTISKILAKELGLVHIDFAEMLNSYLLPRHFKKVGRPYENSFTDIPFDDETATEVQMGEENENLISDIMSNEAELRMVVNNYLERGSPIISILMQRLIKKFWFENPYISTGFVLDGYPRLPNDAEDMITSFCIPDLIIELESSSESAIERLSPLMFNKWKSQLNEAKEKIKVKLDIERENWINFTTKHVVIKLIILEIINNLCTSDEEPVEMPSTDSVVIDAHPSGSLNVDVNLFNIYNDFIQEFPEPIDLTEWENSEDVRERIDTRIENIYEIDYENIQNMKDVLTEQNIKVVSVNGTKSIDKVIRVVFLKLSGLRNRNESFLEQSIVINKDIAEMLLLEGFYFLSKFKRMCPVHLFENPETTFNTYKPSRRKGKIFTVAHRSYIYFISSKEYVRKFRNNPLKYVDNCLIKSFIEYPLRISVIGAPKSGRSSLVKKISRRYGLVCVSRGSALRSVLDNMHWTELASKITKQAQSGGIIDYELVTQAVQTVLIDHRTSSEGFILDGFPEFPKEGIKLANEGLYPTIVFCISSDQISIIKYSQMELYYDILKYKPPYSIPFIENRYQRWYEMNYSIKYWINDDYQNLHILDGNESKWQCLQNAIDIIQNTNKKIHYYLVNVKTNIVCTDVMCISSQIFKNRMSKFKDLCPVCLHKNILKHSGYPIDRKGIVQYKDHFYWICQDHKDIVLEHPDCYLSVEPAVIAEIPAPIKTVNVSLVYEKGICIVTYADNLPSLSIIMGSNQFAASYRGNTYLFCTETCLLKFLAEPHLYFDIVVFKQSKEFPEMCLNNIPNLGYLEQTIGCIITDACCSVNVLRPKYPGLSYPLSAALYIALYMKTHNPFLDTTIINKYKKVLKTFEARCKLIMDVGLRLRSMNNPFADYPKCCNSRTMQSSVSMSKDFEFALMSSNTSDIKQEFEFKI